jgi:hypothetical protein
LSSTIDINTTIKAGTIDSVFKEVTHSESLGLRNPAQLCLFHLKLDGDTFTNEGFYKCLRKNIGQYVYSRTRIAKFKEEDDEASIGLEAMQLINDQRTKNPDSFGNMLGEILLYAFFEEKLGAPKIFSKIELDSLTSESFYDGIHLLKMDDTSFQMVFGTSYVEDQMDDAILKIKNELNQPKRGIALVNDLVFAQSADTILADALSKIITPAPDALDVDSAYGIFLCCSFGLDKSKYTVAEYKKLVEQKMVSNIHNYLPRIKKHIDELGLSGRSFYIYVVPLDDATEDKTIIMKKVTGGAYGN